MNVLDTLRTRAAAHPAHIVLSEGEDPRIIAAAAKAVEAGLGPITLVGPRSSIDEACQSLQVQLSDDLRIADPHTSPLAQGLAERFAALRAHKGVTLSDAQQAVKDPLVFSAMMVRCGHADGTVGGAVATTSDTVRAALQCIGKAPDADLVSSFFLMILPEGHPSGRAAMIFSDSGLVIDPNASELASIAEQAAGSYQALLAEAPKVALLSFSTKGSARHPNVTKVTDALSLLQEKRPDLSCDGELQFDAAFVPEVGAKKAPGSDVAGEANVLIFPNLDAGNIGYKIAQRVSACIAIGPILQGLAQPANDLSRGCSADDVFHMISVTTLQVAAAKGSA